MLQSDPSSSDREAPASHAGNRRRDRVPSADVMGTSARLFDLWSGFYDNEWVQSLAYRPVHDTVLDSLRRAPRRAILDVGCGTGLFATRISDELRDSRVVGCDFSRGMLGRARRRCRRVEWVQGNALDLPFSEGAFDTVVSTEAFHWFPEPGVALSQIFRVLAPGGQLMLALINPPSALVSDLVRAGSRWIGEPVLWPTRPRLRGWLERAGFDLESQRRIRRIPFGQLLPPVLSIATRPSS